MSVIIYIICRDRTPGACYNIAVGFTLIHPFTSFDCLRSQPPSTPTRLTPIGLISYLRLSGTQSNNTNQLNPVSEKRNLYFGIFFKSRKTFYGEKSKVFRIIRNTQNIICSFLEKYVFCDLRIQANYAPFSFSGIFLMFRPWINN